MLRALGVGLLLGGLVIGCGGRTEGGSPESGNSSPEPGNASPDEDQSMGDGSGSGCGQLHGQCDTDADTELGECTLGFPVFGTGKPCAWVADDRCYDTREMACNCECPRDRDSQCVSGFDDGPDGRVLVECR